MSDERIRSLEDEGKAHADEGNHLAAAQAYEAAVAYAANNDLPVPYHSVIEAARNYGEYGKRQASEGNLTAALNAVSKSRDLLNEVIDANVPEELRQVAYQGKEAFESALAKLKNAIMGSGGPADPVTEPAPEPKKEGTFPWLIVAGVALYLMRRR